MREYSAFLTRSRSFPCSVLALPLAGGTMTSRGLLSMHAVTWSAVAVLSAAVSCTAESPENRACRDMGASWVAEFPHLSGDDESNRIRETFHSRRFDTCIYAEISRVGVNFEIRDLSRSILRDGPKGWNKLLHCDLDGADSVAMDKVRARRGYVFNLPYSEYVDDGFGGPPRCLKTPDQPYTRGDCQRVFDRWIRVLKE